jgi:hypothetical protein
MAVTWKEFAEADPQLAEIGAGLLFQFGVGLAFLATIRKDGAPRLHPFCPVMSGERLYGLIQAESPKKFDLMRDGRYAMQAFPPPREESEEFYLSGVARLIEDPAIRKSVLADAKHIAHESEVLFEFLIDRAMYTAWENWGTPDIKPVHTIWKASQS